MYAACVQAGVCARPVSAHSATRYNYYDNAQFKDFPVVYVTWEDAHTYCAWAGRRLPTEAEWEKAARGTDARLYPWGNSDPGPTRTNFRNLKGDTTPVGAYPENASPYGAVDMAGNVWEWVNDWYKGSYYRDANSPLINPHGPSSSATRGLRGGAWNSDLNAIRTAHRFQYGPTSRSDSIGFRCVR
jgi:formylglycine-generating enzyme required for sulfatase activity